MPIRFAVEQPNLARHTWGRGVSSQLQLHGKNPWEQGGESNKFIWGWRQVILMMSLWYERNATFVYCVN